MSYRTNILKAAENNTDFRRVLYTTERSQLVLMSVGVGEEIGLETHDLDQVLVFVSGQGETILEGERAPIGGGDVVVVPAGVAHNFVNTGTVPLKLFTVYAPAEHEAGTIHQTKAEADLAEAAEHAEEAAAKTTRGFTVGSLRGERGRT